MSIDALSWAFQTPVKPASAKLTLICIADNANHCNEAWPSLDALIAKTSLDRKTVIASLDALEAAGLIFDTGKRAGSTHQVKVYRIVGLDDGNQHYTYRVTDKETGEFYIGVRSCWGDIERDRLYMGSGKWPLEQVKAKRPLEKEILQIHATRAEAIVAEAAAIRDASIDPLNRNVTHTKNGTVPKTERFRFFRETVPKTVHGTIIEPSIKEERARARENAPSQPDNKPPKPTYNPETGTFDAIHRDHIDRWTKAFPAINLDAEIARAAAWLYANPANRKSDYLRFLTTWLSRAQDRAPRQTTTTGAFHARPQSPRDRRDAERDAFADAFFGRGRGEVIDVTPGRAGARD